MSGAWWKSDRSKLAASVRATRRRMRANYRASLESAMLVAVARLEADYRGRFAELARAEQLAVDAAGEMSRPEVCLRDYQLDKLIGCEIRLARDLFLRMKNPSELIGAVCQMIGRAVEQAAYKYARNETRQFGPAPRVVPPMPSFQTKEAP